MKFAGEMQKWDPTLPNAARNKDRSRFHLMPEIKILAEIKEITFSTDSRNENVAKNKTDHIFTRYQKKRCCQKYDISRFHRLPEIKVLPEI